MQLITYIILKLRKISFQVLTSRQYLNKLSLALIVCLSILRIECAIGSLAAIKVMTFEPVLRCFRSAMALHSTNFQIWGEDKMMETVHLTT